MSKISEQKALEAYPIKYAVLPFCFSIPDLNESYRKPYQEGYDQAMQDFLEKAEKWIEDNFSISEGMSGYWVANNFKNYIQKEKEDK